MKTLARLKVISRPRPMKSDQMYLTIKKAACSQKQSLRSTETCSGKTVLAKISSRRIMAKTMAKVTLI